MRELPEEMVNIKVHLKSGAAFLTVLPAHKEYKAESLTDKTLHWFASRDGKRRYFTQGGNIDYIEVELLEATI